MIKRLLHDLLSFVKRPTDERLQLNLKERLLALIMLFGIDTVLAYGGALISDFAEAETHAEGILDSSLEGTFGMFLGIVLVPFIEEIIFRYFFRYERINPWLISRKKWNAISPFLFILRQLLLGWHIFLTFHSRLIIISGFCTLCWFCHSCSED